METGIRACSIMKRRLDDCNAIGRRHLQRLTGWRRYAHNANGELLQGTKCSDGKNGPRCNKMSKCQRRVTIHPAPIYHRMLEAQLIYSFDARFRIGTEKTYQNHESVRRIGRQHMETLEYLYIDGAMIIVSIYKLTRCSCLTKLLLAEPYNTI